MTEPLRILHVAAPAHFGGLERVVQALAVGQRRLGHDVRVLAILDVAGAEAHPFPAELERAGVPVERVPLPPRAYLRERRVMREACHRGRAQIVHTHGARVDVVDAPVARRLGIATVATAHGFTGGGWKNRVYERLQLAAYRRCDAVVAVSRPLLEALRRGGVPADRLHLVPNAWMSSALPLDRATAREALGAPDGSPHIGWVGRVSPEKGLDVLLDAVRLLDEPPVVVSVLGDGAQLATLKARAGAHAFGARIRWHGAVPDAGRLFPGFDLFVLSSRTEGVPMVLFEAMQAGVPIIATRVGGVPDVLSANEALLVSPGDPAALATAIQAVLQDPLAAASRAQAARARLGLEFAVEPWLAAYEAVYADARRPS